MLAGPPQRVGVFAGSVLGTNPAYAAAATAVGSMLAARGVTVVVMGAVSGLLECVVTAALAGGAQVVHVVRVFYVSAVEVLNYISIFCCVCE